MAFEEFAKTNYRRGGDEVAVIIYTSGALTLTRAAHQAINEPQYVRVSVDREAHLIAFDAANSEDPGSFKLNGVRRISAVRFLRWANINVSAKTRLPAVVEDGRLVVHVNGMMSS